MSSIECSLNFNIASIPVIVLRRAKMKTRQKFAVGSFLCLSLVMVAMAVARVSKMHGVTAMDIPYEYFWQYLEAAVALLMASLTSFRTFFVIAKQRKRYQERMKRPLYSFREFRSRFGGRRHEEDVEGTELPEIPRATMTGMWTYIHSNNRIAVAGTVDDTSLMLSQQEPLGSSGCSAPSSFIAEPGSLMLRSTSARSLMTRVAAT
ncbi:uncharacterized protein BDZ99DRAFT_574927 [Mytilinidion resinicola]|uniref:Rhodopsin domain-containing protein n=1 Tax=Mytilinidion resinicola TaxID=574789 RepID=A0A6A6Y950_9PEZI|nr:uncharacterized protein BDZ99DRAFT_574927 [Mytilinidion resinicola]KAF2805346.1 hypothetical protein BDZ99DRAFT_574927 [Mytilinidion resinicola]